MGATELIGVVLILILIAVVLFLFAREAMCWYWKVNEQLEVLRKIDSSLDAIRRSLTAVAAPAAAIAGAAAHVTAIKKCRNCGHEVTQGTRFCEECGTEN